MIISSKRDLVRADYFFAREQSHAMREARWARPSLWDRIKEFFS
jgi:hypothetical protein